MLTHIIFEADQLLTIVLTSFVCFVLLIRAFVMFWRWDHSRQKLFEMTHLTVLFIVLASFKVWIALCIYGLAFLFSVRHIRKPRAASVVYHKEEH